MIARMFGRWTLLVAVFMVLSAISTAAWASHYRIALLEVFDEQKVEALIEVGIVTTEDFLINGLTRAQRQQLSEQSGISELEVLVFARLCELLQIEGVGPRAAQLLRAAGIVSVSDLAGRDPTELTQQLGAVNAVEQLTGITPAVENVEAWISDAALVPYHLD